MMKLLKLIIQDFSQLEAILLYFKLNLARQVHS